ncbi:MAG: glycosyltransferase [Selenomonadaceae bacterium]|nr:glycosyltransferase [Selenomonadaceae bacterium]
MKISVIIPVYNTEKYLAVCLESLLIQTLTDFEVIIVDDCSTDSSLSIAESYLEKFGGRLKIITLEANTGSGAVPRNVGLEYARGEYVYFVDADDLIIDTALETFYNFAEEYKAEVIYPDSLFVCNAEPIPKNITIASWDPSLNVEIPTFDTNDFSERMKKFLALQYKWPPWAKFLRRDFLIDNNIKFPSMRISEDIFWTFKLVCLAKRFLYIPTPLYVQRSNETSMTRSNRSAEQDLIFWINPLLQGVEHFDEFMNTIDFFYQNPGIRLQVLNLFVNIHFQHMFKAFNELEPQAVYEIFLREFSKAGSTQPALISYLLVTNNLYRNELLTK